MEIDLPRISTPGFFLHNNCTVAVLPISRHCFVYAKIPTLRFLLSRFSWLAVFVSKPNQTKPNQAKLHGHSGGSAGRSGGPQRTGPSRRVDWNSCPTHLWSGRACEASGIRYAPLYAQTYPGRLLVWFGLVWFGLGQAPFQLEISQKCQSSDQPYSMFANSVPKSLATTWGR